MIRVITGFPSFMVDVPETVLLMSISLSFVPRGAAIGVLVVITSTLLVELPVVLGLAGMLAFMFGSDGRRL
jgi:hypothetical protein